MRALAPSSTTMTAALQRGAPPRMIELRIVTFFARIRTYPWMSRPLITWFGVAYT
jgi:hypothetical protein